MHKRIRKLAEQANVLENDFYDNESELQKFAELIVRECAEVVYSRSGHATPQDLYEHFGVEE